jgi:serine/threonine-protein kinase
MAALAFEMLTGKAPFVDETLAKVFERIIRAPLPVAREFAPELPPSIEAFFTRALARPASERFGSARELVEALRLALSGSEPLAAAAKPQPKARWLAVGVVAAIALGALLLGRRADPAPAVAPVTATPEPAPTRASREPARAGVEGPELTTRTASPMASVAPAESARRRAVSATAVRASAPAASAEAVDPEFGIPLQH